MSIEKIKTVADQIVGRLPAVKGRGEEATKQALILPMLDALGYDIWNPSEVCPEFEADFAIKKAGQKEKVDIALILNGIPRVYMEVKPVDFLLDGHEGQLARYFNATQSVTLGVLTNGIEWRFFTDTGDPNVMDSHPFHVSRVDSVDQGLDVVARFAKPVFSPEAIRDYATELRYTAQIASFLKNEIDLKEKDPSEYFIRWILKSEKMYDGVVNVNVVDRFKPIVKAGLTRVIREIVRRSITAMDIEAAPGNQIDRIIEGGNEQSTPSGSDSTDGCCIEEEKKSGIQTTDRELAVFAIVKGIFDKSKLAARMIHDAASRRSVPIEIAYKDTTGYFGIYLNKPSWWIMRAAIESRKPWVGFNVDAAAFPNLIPPGFQKLEPHPHADFRISISTPEDILQLSPIILATAEKLIQEKTSAQPESAGMAKEIVHPS